MGAAGVATSPERFWKKKRKKTVFHFSFGESISDWWPDGCFYPWLLLRCSTAQILTRVILPQRRCQQGSTSLEIFVMAFLNMRDYFSNHQTFAKSCYIYGVLIPGSLVFYTRILVLLVLEVSDPQYVSPFKKGVTKLFKKKMFGNL